MDSESLSGLFDDSDFGGTNMASPDDIFSILGAIESVTEFCPLLQIPNDKDDMNKLVSQKSSSSILSAFQESENELEFAASPKSKRQKFSTTSTTSEVSLEQEGNQDGEQNKMSHITVERNRRKQMNEHLTVLRSLMPCFYVKRGDQASIIGGVVDYINELHQLLQSLEAKKQRKSVYNEVLSPRVNNVSSPRIALSSTLQLSPRKPPLSPRMSLPISPRTPSSPYKPKLPYSPSCSSSTNCSSTNNDNKNNDNFIVMNELVANVKSAIADVEVKFTASSNVLLKTISPRIPGQATKIISALEDLSLEILQVNIHTIDEKMLNSFTIKIGIECRLSAEELAHQIQQTFR